MANISSRGGEIDRRRYDSDSGLGLGMAGTIFLLVTFLTPLKSRMQSRCQHLGKWRNMGTKSQWRRDSFSSKVLLSMEIDALAARTPEC
jgi:hypothetical protein